MFLLGCSRHVPAVGERGPVAGAECAIESAQEDRQASDDQEEASTPEYDRPIGGVELADVPPAVGLSESPLADVREPQSVAEDDEQ